MNEVTIKDIAERTGVSYATVSRTLNHRYGVNPETREKIIAAAEEMGYHPNLHARGLKTNKTNTIALIIPDISNPYFSDLAHAVSEEAYQRGYITILCSANWDPEIEKAQLNTLRSHHVDGIIYKPSVDLGEEVPETDVPLVIVSNMSSEGQNYIEVDNIKGGRIAAAHLMECGYRRIAFAGGQENSLSDRMRLQGLRTGLEAAGLRVDNELVRHGPFTCKGGYAAAESLMTQDVRPDGIFCGNDKIALGVFQYLVEKGYRVPEDVGIIGFDDIYLASLPQIQLTTIATPRFEMGRLAADMLIRKIENEEERAKVEHVLLDTELIVRRSTRK